MGLLEASKYTLKRRMFSIGASVDIFDEFGAQIGFCKQKVFKLKKDFRIYTDASKTEEILCILAQRIVDFNASFDVISAKDELLIGTWYRKGLASILRDTWKFETPDGEKMELTEDSESMAVARRVVTNLIPQNFYLRKNGEVIAEFKQHMNPLSFGMDVTLFGKETKKNAAVIAAAAVLLCVVEGRQNKKK